MRTVFRSAIIFAVVLAIVIPFSLLIHVSIENETARFLISFWMGVLTSAAIFTATMDWIFGYRPLINPWRKKREKK